MHEDKSAELGAHLRPMQHSNITITTHGPHFRPLLKLLNPRLKRTKARAASAVPETAYSQRVPLPILAILAILAPPRTFEGRK